MTTPTAETAGCPRCGAEVALASFLSIRLPDDIDLLVCAQVARCEECGLSFPASDPKVVTPREGRCPACGRAFELPARPFDTEAALIARELAEAERAFPHGVAGALDGVDPDRYPSCPACGFTTEYGVFAGDRDAPAHELLRRAHAFLGRTGGADGAVEVLEASPGGPDRPFSQPCAPVLSLLEWWRKAKDRTRE